MAIMMAVKASFGGAIGIDNRRGWWHGDSHQGSKMLRYCNFGNMIRQPRDNLHVSAIGGFRVGISEKFDNQIGLFHEVVNDSGNEKTISVENLDQWLHNSLTEIVKNIGEEPLMVQIYTENGPKQSQISSTSTTNNNKLKYVMQKVTSDGWTNITQRWENNPYTNIPYGIIFVEEICAKHSITNITTTTTTTTTIQDNQHKTSCFLDYKCNNLNNNNNNDNNNNNNKDIMMGSSSSPTRMWGVVVQGKGINVPSCYLLKTCQVDCCFVSTTHFSLAKVDNNCFGNSVDFHLNNFWLQR